MLFLFLDNFRGFANTIIPLTDVNFLVGENSTGKSSVLGLLKIISSHRLWFTSDFNTEEVRFGHFQDMVSVHAKDRSAFTIGLLDTRKDGNRGGSIGSKGTFFLATLEQRDGVPRPAIYSFGDYSAAVTVRQDSEKARFRRYAPVSLHNSEVTPPNMMLALVKEHFALDVAFESLHKPTQRVMDGGGLWELEERVQMSIEDKKVRFPRLYRYPPFSDDLVWLAPIRSKPRRTYDEYRIEFSAEGDHVPYVIKKILERKREAGKFASFLERVGRDSGLFDKVTVREYGRGATAPFELDVVLNRKPLSISNVGYGVSQSLPVIVELFVRPKGTWFAVQQPEVHLHPKAQAAIGDVVFELAVREEKHFLVETHSDYMIDRFRTNFRNNPTVPNSQIIFFERCKLGNVAHVIPIQSNGEISSSQPEGYRSFFVGEHLRVLGG